MTQHGRTSDPSSRVVSVAEPGWPIESAADPPGPAADPPGPAAEAGEGGTEPVTDGDAGSPGARPDRRRALLIAIASLAAVVALAAAGIVLGVMTHDQRTATNDEESATASARQWVMNLITTDPATAVQSFARLKDGATGSLAQQLGGQSDQFVQAVQTANVVSQGAVTESGVARSDPTSATVLVVADSTVRNGQAPQGEPRRYRMSLQMQKQGDVWLVSKLDFVP